METKVCKVCGIEKPLTEFFKQGHRHQARCKACYPAADYALKKNHGLTREQWNVMWETQNGRCAICERELIKTCKGKNCLKGAVAVVDHNHKTGRIRGLLCYSCNMGIGMLQDSAQVCELAANYLHRDSY